MKTNLISFHPTFKQLKINPSKEVSTNNNITNVKTCDIVETTNFISEVDAICKLTNLFSKEDMKKIEAYKKEYSLLNKAEELKKQKEKIKKELWKNFHKLPILHTHNRFSKKYICDYKTEFISIKDRDALKDYYLRLFAINKVINKDNPQVYNPTIKDWFKEAPAELGMPKLQESSSYFEHLESKALRTFGGYFKDDTQKINIYKTIYSYLDSQDIFKMKLEVLTKMNSYLGETRAEFEGTFSEKEINKIKKLSMKYHALDEIHKKQGVFTKSIESILFAPEIDDKVKKGDYINNLGYVVNRIKINNKEFITTFNKINALETFAMYSLDELKAKDKFINKIKESSKIDLNELNSEAKQVIDNNKALVSFISFAVYTKKIKTFMEDYAKTKNRNVKNIIKDNKYFYEITNFRNLYPQKNDKAGKIVGLQLLKFLKERNCTPIFLTAENFVDGKHSPVSLYLRAGFKPYSHSKSEIEKQMAKNKSEFPKDISVLFYLDEFKENDTIDKLIKFYNL